jgi:hypothetical protein
MKPHNAKNSHKQARKRGTGTRKTGTNEHD